MDHRLRSPRTTRLFPMCRLAKPQSDTPAREKKIDFCHRVRTGRDRRPRAALASALATSRWTDLRPTAACSRPARGLGQVQGVTTHHRPVQKGVRGPSTRPEYKTRVQDPSTRPKYKAQVQGPSTRPDYRARLQGVQGPPLKAPGKGSPAPAQ